MERKKAALTPEQYARAIISLSRRYSSTSVFPGNNYLDIAEWMLQERSLLSLAKVEGDSQFFAPKSEPHHDLVVVYNSSDRKWALQQYTQEEYEAFSAAGPGCDDGSGQIVFIRGFISPSWVAAIGSRYQIDPEFFRRHMDFLTVSIDRHAYSSPSLASTSSNTFRLCISTLLRRDNLGERNIHAQRKDQSLQLATYKTEQLGYTKVSCGDSLVRNYSTVCSSFSVIEQWISICITKQDNKWIVLAWMDQGRPLERSPPGPWTSHIQCKATALPVLQHHHKMAFRTTTNRLDTDANATSEMQQSATILPLQYDSLIALVDLARRAPQDPLSMCIPLFAHAAFSELQFLNLIESRIQIHINAIPEGVPADALSTFQFFSNILNRHVQQLKESLHALSKLADRHSPSSSLAGASKPEFQIFTRNNSLPHTINRSHNSETDTSRPAPDGPFTIRGLVESYEDLHARCTSLSEMCSRGITLAMTKATIDESRKGIEQSERLKRLTLLATFFIPLSFCTSLFGMNLDILSHNGVQFWWFFVLCVPILVVTAILYLCDWGAVMRFWRKVGRGWNGKLRARESSRKVVEDLEKDPEHMA